MLFFCLFLWVCEIILQNQTTRTVCWNSKNVVAHNSYCLLHLMITFYLPTGVVSSQKEEIICCTWRTQQGSLLLSQLPHPIVSYTSLIIFFSSRRPWTQITTSSFLDSFNVLNATLIFSYLWTLLCLLNWLLFCFKFLNLGVLWGLVLKLLTRLKKDFSCLPLDWCSCENKLTHALGSEDLGHSGEIVHIQIQAS